MAKHPNEWYAEGLRSQKPEALRSIFDEFLPMVTGFICNNNGTREDARDVFMDAIEALFRKAQAGELVVTSAFSTFLIEICKRHWLNKLRRKKFDAGVTPDELPVSNTIGDMDTPLETTERYKLMSEKFALLQKDCQMVLSLSWHAEMGMEDIAEQMGWTYGYARKRKHACKEHLITLVKNDPRYQELRA